MDDDKKQWTRIEASKIYPCVTTSIWSNLYNTFDLRFDQQRYPIHHVANALRPDTVSDDSIMDAHAYEIVAQWLGDQTQHKTHGLSNTEKNALLLEFNEFRSREGGTRYHAESPLYMKKIKPQQARTCISAQVSLHLFIPELYADLCT